MRVRFSFSSKLSGKQKKPDSTNKHKVPFPKLVQEVIRTSDIILEVIDARFIEKTRNPELEKSILSQNKKLIYILTKADLVDFKDLKLNYDLHSLQPYVLFSSKSRIGRARLRELIKIEASRLKRDKVRVGIIGYPNTGKSSLINVLSKGRRAGTSPNAGFTKTIQKIRFSKDILILDSPGVIPAREENSINSAIVTKQTEIGVKSYNKVKYPDLIVQEIMKESPKIFDEFYNIDSQGDVELLLESLGKKWNFLSKGGIIDTDRTARRILKDWQEGRIKGKISQGKLANL